jgi:hypothetical protein
VTPVSTLEPAYLALHRSGELAVRARLALQRLAGAAIVGSPARPATGLRSAVAVP